MHYNYDITPVNAIRATAFFSRGRGGGSSLNSAGTVPFNLLAADGSIANATVADTLYLKNAYQRDSYSFHQQWGILTNYEMQANENVKLIFGAEFRSWTADHPGYFTNLFGKANLSAQSYGIIDSTGAPTTTTFRRRTFQNDFAQSSDMALWGWDPPNDPTYQSQYRNYRGETPQFTLFTNAIISIEKLTLTGTIQYVGYTYKLTENMPSENAMGRRLTQAEILQLGLGTSRDEGPDRSGKFYMKEYASTSSQNVRNWYVFDLVNATRTRQFWQPKFGANYNLDENINFMANFSHVQRFVDLGVYYNQGRVNDKAGDEISNQFEVGMGWRSEFFNAKINAYSMTWDNKSSRIQDVSMAGQPGYDRNGYRTILVGKSLNQGIELEFRGKLDMLVEGLEYRGSATLSDNKWKSVLDEVKTDPTTGRRQIFNSSNGFTAAGMRDTVFMDELAGTHVGGPPQTMASLGLTYRFSDFFVGIDANYFADQWGLDGEPFLRIGGEWTNLNDLRNGFTYTYNQKVPGRVLFDAQAGYDFTFEGIQGGASVQVLNIFNKEFVADIDNFGVLPGTLRTLRLNLKLGL